MQYIYLEKHGVLQKITNKGHVFRQETLISQKGPFLQINLQSKWNSNQNLKSFS